MRSRFRQVHGSIACRAHAGASPRVLCGRWTSITSSICRPIVSTGFSAVIGSWKIIAMRLPRSVAQARRRAP